MLDYANLRIAIVRNSESLPSDTSGARLWRSGLYAKYLHDKGYSVDWYTSSFDHYNGKQRTTVEKFEVGSSLHNRIKLVKTCGYNRNVSLKRFWDHACFAFKTFFLMKKAERPDLILCSYPTPDSCFAVMLFGKIYGVPVVLDVRDQWPDVFYEKRTGMKLFVSKLALLPYIVLKKISLSKSDTIMAANQDFLNWALRTANRTQSSSDFVNYIPFEAPQLTDKHYVECNEILCSSEFNKKSYLFTFAGTIGQMFDFDALYQSLDNGLIPDQNVGFLICGRGSELQNLKDKFSRFTCVYFTGQLDSRTVFALLQKSTALLAPYRDMANFRNHLPNKFMEYCAAGKPLVSSLTGYASKLLIDNEFGETYRTPNEFADIIRTYMCDDEKRHLHGENSRIMYQTIFNPKSILADMEKQLLSTIEKYKKGN